VLDMPPTFFVSKNLVSLHAKEDLTLAKEGKSVYKLAKVFILEVYKNSIWGS